MDVKEKKTMTALQTKTNRNTESLTKDVDIHRSNTNTLLTLWDQKLQEYEDTAIRYPLVASFKSNQYDKSYQRMLTKHMQFKDKLIENLQKELYEFKEHRRRTGQTNLELINNILCAFKKEMEVVHGQYLFEVSLELPADLAELQLRKNENDDNWRALKYHENVLQIQAEKKESKIENNHIGYKDSENGRFISNIDTFCRSDLNHFKKMLNDYISLLNEYKNKTGKLIKDYNKLKKKHENLHVLKRTLKTRIEDLSNSITHLEQEKKELKSLKEKNKLIKERQEAQEGLEKFIKKIKNCSERGEKQLLLLCQTAKPIRDELKYLLKKGNSVLECISLCQKLETSEDKVKLLSTCNKSNSIPWPQPMENGVLEILDCKHFLNYLCDTNISSKLMDKLQRENNDMKKKIRCIVQQKQ